MNNSEISTLIETRRSHFTKEFNGQKASQEFIELLLKNANWAPSHKLTMPWHFIVFEGQSLKLLTEKIIDIQLSKNQNLEKTKIEKLNLMSNMGSHAIAICYNPSNIVPKWEEYSSIGAAVQNMYLTLNSQNDFGGYWTTGNATNEPEMNTFLGLNEHQEHLGFFIVGGISEKRTHSNRKSVSVEWK